MKKIFWYIAFVICSLACIVGAYGLIYFGLHHDFCKAFVYSSICAINLLSIFNLYVVYNNEFLE